MDNNPVVLNGLTLRDCLAIAVYTAGFSARRIDKAEYNRWAEASYDMADALLTARNKQSNAETTGESK